MSLPSGYVHCSHLHCFAIFIGKPGELCEDCAAQTELVIDQPYCDGCDNDSVVDSDDKVRNDNETRN